MPARWCGSAAFLLGTILGATASGAGAPAGEPPQAGAPANPAGEPEAPAWVPGPGAREALEALWAAKPFELDAAKLARASGGTVPRMNDEETLLKDESVRLDAHGGSTEIVRVVWRILSDDPHQTITWTWSPWRQDKPQVRARVVSAEGTETRLDPAAVIESAVAVDDLQISDVHQLQIPLPSARRGAVVELEVTTTSTRDVLEGAGREWSTPLWTVSPVRKRRCHVEAPEGVPLQVRAVGVDPPPVRVEGGVQRVDLDVGELPFRPYQMTQVDERRQSPRLGWSTAASWNDVAVRYGKLIQPVLAEKAELKHVRIPPKATTVQKVQAVARAMRDRLRYTAVHLGDGAVVPTRPSVVQQRGYGDCKDLAVLMASALREAGVECSVALTVADGDVPRDDLPGIESFDHMVVVVKNGNERLWVDATAPEYPVGSIPAAWRDQRALIIEPTTQGLVDTPSADETRGAFRVIYDLRPGSFGFGDATVTSSAADAAEGMFRSTLQRCDETEARKLIQGDLQPLFGDAPHETHLAGCLPGDGPVVITADYKAAKSLDTTDQQISISLPSRVPDDIVTDAARGVAPGSDQRDDASRKEADRQNQERTGLTKDELENVPFKFSARTSSERVYRVTLPPHFVAASLPASRTVKMGPSTLTEKATQVDPRTVEVSFLYELDKTDWSVDDVKAFRAAYWKRYDETMPSLVARFEPAQMIEENRAADAAALVHGWLAAKPDDAVTRARYARVLLGMGLGDVAADEAERAAKDAPDDPLVNLARGDVARHDRFGVLYQPPFDRAKAIDAFRKLLKKTPDHNYAVRALADTLRRNDRGELELDWTPDVAAAASLLQDLADRGLASDENKKLLAEMYTRGHRAKELSHLFEQDPASRSSNDSNVRVMLAALEGDADAALVAVHRADTPQAEFLRLGMAMGTFAQMERYDEARKVVEGFHAGPAFEQQMIPLQAMVRSLKPVPEGAAVTDPASGAKAVLALAAHASTPTALNHDLARLASDAYRKELNDGLQRPVPVRMPRLEPRTVWMWIYHGGQCVSVSAGRATRVRCAVPENPELSLTTYWSQDGDQLHLESLGSYRDLAARAREAAVASRLDEAKGWIDWYLDLLLADKNDGKAAQLLRDYWGQAARTDADAVRLAADQASVLFSDMAREADASVIDDMERGRAALTGSLKRRLDLRIADVRDDRKELHAAIERLQPVAESEGEAWMLQSLAELESDAGLPEQAMSRVDKALAADPRNVEWREIKARVLSDTGRYGEAATLLGQLRTETGATSGLVLNNYLWARLLAGDLDDDCEREARRITAPDKKDVRSTEMHTAAMVLLERGRVKDAAQLGLRLQSMQVTKVMDDARWLLRGRLLSVFGFSAQSRAAYAKMTENDPGMTALVRRFQGSDGRAPASAPAPARGR